MKYLVDTNVFFHTINSCIYQVAKKCKDEKNDVCITQTIINELEPSYYHNKDNPSSAEISIAVQNCVTDGVFKVINLIDISSVPGAKEKLKSIRKKYYEWMTRTDYLQKLIDSGTLTEADIKSKAFRKKDLGECELLAIALASKGQYIIVTNDKGKVYCHPYQNVFENYIDEDGIVIYKGDIWLKKINIS